MTSSIQRLATSKRLGNYVWIYVKLSRKTTVHIFLLSVHMRAIKAELKKSSTENALKYLWNYDLRRKTVEQKNETRVACIKDVWHLSAVYYLSCRKARVFLVLYESSLPRNGFFCMLVLVWKKKRYKIPWRLYKNTRNEIICSNFNTRNWKMNLSSSK